LSYLVVGEDHIDCPFALEKLNAVYNINVVRILSGGVLNGILLRKCLVDEVIVFLHPELVGGMSQKSFFVADDLDSPDGVIKLRLKDVLRLRNDVVLLTYDVVKR